MRNVVPATYWRTLTPCAVLALLVCGCPPQSSSNDNGNGNSNGGSSVSDGARMSSLQEAQQVVDAIGLDGDPAKTDQIAEALKGMSAFERVEAGDGVVYAKFSDGEFLVVMNNRPNLDPSDVMPTSKRINAAARKQAANAESGLLSSTPIGGPRAHQSARRFALKSKASRAQSADTQPRTRVPESNKAVLVNTMGNDYCDVTSQISPWLSGAGYAVHALDGGVESLRTGVKDVGVFYYNGHGSVVPSWAVPLGLKSLVDGFPHFGLWTKTKVTADNLPTYRGELGSGFLIYALCPTDRVAGNLNDCLDRKGSNANSEYHYCLTDYFINKYWRCKPGAVLYMDCCHGAQIDSLLPDLCVMPDVGASVVVGWTAATLDQWATPTALYFFDRLTGANDYPPLVSPPRRAYSLNGVLQAMTSVIREALPMDQSPSFKGLHTVQITEPQYVARLIAVYADDTSDLVLRPGIKQISVNEGQKRLILEGDFGADAGSVMLDGSPLALAGTGWATNRIECELPSGSFGTATVSTGGRSSNPRRLTQWQLTLHHLFMDYPTQQATNCPSCFYEATLHFTLRGDISSVRGGVEDGVVPAGFTGYSPTGDLAVTNAGGTYSIGQGSSITLAPNPAHGAALIGTCVGFNPPVDNNYFGACYYFNGAAGQLAFAPTLFAEAILRNYHGGAFDGIVDPFQISYSGNITGNELLMTVSPNYNIEAGQKSTGANSYFQWEGAAASNPPAADDPR